MIIIKPNNFWKSQVLPHIFISLFHLFHGLQMPFHVVFNICQIIGGFIFQTCLCVFVHCIKWLRMNISWVPFKSHHCRNACLEVFIKGNAWEVKGEDGGGGSLWGHRVWSSYDMTANHLPCQMVSRPLASFWFTGVQVI